MPAPLALRIPRPEKPAIEWRAWTVVARAHGFHVSREEVTGSAQPNGRAEPKRETLTNEVGRTKIFRSLERAQLACDQANRAA
jgi:hypothetical protein